MIGKKLLRSASNLSGKSPSLSSSPHSSPVKDHHSKLASKYWKRFDGFVSAQSLSVGDGIRLLSFDYLFKRSIQYHMTNHCFHPGDRDQIEAQTSPVDPTEAVVEMQTFKFGQNTTKTKLLRLPDLEGLDHNAFDVIWLNILNISILPRIIEKFEFDSLMGSYFYDLRPHSIVIPSERGIFVSLSNVQIADVFTCLVKLYMYISKNVIITFEKEIFPDKEAASSSTSNPEQEFNWIQEHFETRSIDSLRSQISSLKAAMNVKTLDKVAELGPQYLLYEIALHSHILSSTVLELFSRNISHLPQAVSLKNPSSRHKRLTFRRVCTQAVAIENLRSIILRQVDVAQLVVSSASLSDPVKPYYSHLIESLHYRLDCLVNLQNQLNYLRDVMTQIHALCTESTSKNLNLIATMFLPLTFFAGVFGMNFQQDGGYTIEVLNMRRGPDIFWALCGLVVIFNIYFFINSGLMHLERDKRTIFGFALLPDDLPPDEEPTRESLLRMKVELEESEEGRRHSQLNSDPSK